MNDDTREDAMQEGQDGLEEFESELREVLAPLAFRPRALELVVRPEPADAAIVAPGTWRESSGETLPRPSRWERRLAAAVVAALLVLAVALSLRAALGTRGEGDRSSASTANVVQYRLDGSRSGGVGEALAPNVLAPGVLVPGALVELGDDMRARIAVGDLGQVELEPGARLVVADEALRATGDAEVLLLLERGTLRASIFAAPRLFQVGTPAGLAVDLGCVYEATVEPDGRTRLAVESGLVSFETDARRVVVPAGAWILASPSRPPATPLWEDTPEEFCRAVQALDVSLERGAKPRASDLETVLATDRARDALSLWHLLDHPEAEVRSAVAMRLAELAPPPAGVDAPRCASVAEGAGDERALWWDSFEWAW